LLNGFGAVYLPNALNKKDPNAETEWGWQYVFPAREGITSEFIGIGISCSLKTRLVRSLVSKCL